MIGNLAGFDLSVHTANGITIGELPCRAVPTVSWSREVNQVSRCEFQTVVSASEDLVADLRPWLHWVTVWDGSSPVWTGPMQRMSVVGGVASMQCRDTGTFMWRTRVPITKKWTGLDPTGIAADLWAAMLDLHKIRAVPKVIEGIGNTFNFEAVADSKMLHASMDDLTKIGLKWTVVAGTPVFGNFPTNAIAEFAECDFLTALEVVRDGVNTYNDVRVRGMNYGQTVLVDLAGLRLQRLVSIDDLYGVANITKAAVQYVKEVATIKDLLVVPDGATLHPDAPVTLEELIPGNHFRVSAKDLTALLRLEQLDVVTTPNTRDITVTLESLPDAGELGTLVGVQQ